MITSTQNGHKIIYNTDNNSWYYESGQLAIENIKCKKCGKLPTKDGHDDCISNLPGVKNACCGHGKEGYIQFIDGTIIRGVFEVERTIEYYKSNKRLLKN